jgi:hypothetical protein
VSVVVFLEVIEIMESCGLQYIPSVSIDAGPQQQSSFSKNSQPWKKPFPGTSSSSTSNSNRKPPFSKSSSSSSSDYNVLLNDQMILTLEPNIELLVNYRSIPSSSEKNNNSFPGNRAQQPQYFYNHSYLPSELKHLIYIEQKKYSIRRKVGFFFQSLSLCLYSLFCSFSF